MSRIVATSLVIAVAALFSCSETSYYIKIDPSASSSDNDGGVGGDESFAATIVEATSAASTGGAGGIGGAEDHSSSTASGGADAATAVSTSASSAVGTSSASSSPTLVDCSGGGDDFAMPCEWGVCSRDSVCRPLARCKVAADNWERVVDCLDPNLRSMAVYIVGPARLTQGCVKEQDGNRYKPLSCPTGDKCVISLIDWTVLPRPVSNGVCE